MKRTDNCGELRKADDGNKVVLSGWVHKYRNLGGLIFLDLRDRYGITQILFDPNDLPKAAIDIANSCRNEFVVTVSGTVRIKPEPNKNLATGEIEVVADNIIIENESVTPPFNFLNGKSDAKEEVRLQYRYIDLRSDKMTNNLLIRHKICLAARNYLSEKGFIEIETPTLAKSTPEGARDYLVPSRIYPGNFFALPQSPQIYKQLLMVAGQDKYFQIARCYRDEDSRKDRQPEFTQIDIEQSFVTEEDIFSLTEGMFAYIFKQAADIDIKIPFERLTFKSAMDDYGVDKPDLRFGLKLKNISVSAKNSGFSVFANAECVKFIAVEGLENLSRKQMGEYEDYAKHLGGKGLAFTKVIGGKLDGGISKFLSGEEQKIIIDKAELSKDGIIFFAADSEDLANKILGALRNRLGGELKLFDINEYKFCWIVDFPMFEFNPDENRWQTMHHMFTMPKPEYLQDVINEVNLDKILGQLYDLVLNGVELASGSIRIHKSEFQKKIFKILGMTDAEIENKFGFMLNAFKFGAPPHGGIAPGLDRIVSIICGEESIREVIAFPKSKSQNCLMMNAPSEVDKSQLEELFIEIRKK
ncbi:MAG: aspartate--tRNA ligase [Candidatus Delongbacteria bacterium]|nr:aspartate--tRNA ligase [Candidatus Delongbacteria bacterium]MCG2760087.1 aspartate--tRNA ligase [Candidatus Delongbacteria bacterium]